MQRPPQRISFFFLASLGLYLFLSTPLWAKKHRSSSSSSSSSGGSFQWLQNMANSGDTNQSATVAGVRGLEETSGNVNTTTRDYQAIDRLDKIMISKEELATFKQEGGLKG